MTEYIQTNVDKLRLRFAEEKDTALILGFIRELAVYENLLDQVTATEEVIRQSMFDRKIAEVIISEYEEKPVGFALFFYNFSSFVGKPGIYLEDIYVRPEMRGKGIGKTLLSFLARLAVERDCGRLEWACLDWNESSIRFYKQMGAVPMDEWTVYRVSNQSLMDLAHKFE